MKFKTKIQKAHTNPKFKRTSIPSFIGELWGLEVGDFLEWELDPDDMNRLVVRKHKKEKK